MTMPSDEQKVSDHLTVAANDRKRIFCKVETRRKAWPTALPPWWKDSNKSSVELLNVDTASPADLLYVLLKNEFPEISQLTRDSEAHRSAIKSIIDAADQLATALDFPHVSVTGQNNLNKAQEYPWLRVQYITPIERFLTSIPTISCFEEVFQRKGIWEQNYVSVQIPSENGVSTYLSEYFRIFDYTHLEIFLKVLLHAGYSTDDLVVSTRPDSAAIAYINSLNLSSEIFYRGLKFLGKEDPIILEIRHSAHPLTRLSQPLFVAGFILMLWLRIPEST